MSEETMERLTCCACGTELTREDAIEHFDDIYCEDCHSERFATCDDCGQVVDRDDICIVNEGNSCYRRSHNNEHQVCNDCIDEYYQCRDCGRYYSETNMWDASYNICDNCSDNYSHCTRCGCSVQLDGDDCFEDDNSNYYCRACYNVIQPEHVHEYGFDPELKFYRAPLESEENELFMGVELEIDNGQKQAFAESFHNAYSEELAYMKRDGSLGSQGIEIVTMPMTFNYHMGQFDWKGICEMALEHSYRSHNATNSCGLHVHVSRKGLGDCKTSQDLVIAKIMLIFDKHWDKIVRFSRRKSSDLNDWARKPDAYIEEDDSENTAIAKMNETRGKGRYQAINLRNQHTVEFRVFKGTLRTETIKATLQFLNVLIDYAKRTDLSDIWKTSWEDITKSEYPELNEYLLRRSLNTIQDENEDSEGEM